MTITSGSVNIPRNKWLHEQQIKHQLSNQYHVQHFGYTPEIQSCIFNGKRMVIAGGFLFSIDNIDHSPLDFLSFLLLTILGNEWFNAEATKPHKERHVIVKWYNCARFKFHDPKKPPHSRQFNGDALAYFHLAYDLFVVQNGGYLSDNLVKRLRVESSFNGARYELFVFATMIRAGFKLEIFDESLGQDRVTECRATHIQTGAILQVEAKTRNVKGVLGAQEGKYKNIKLYNKLRDAVEKDVNEPYIIFVDTNLPELDIYGDNDKIKKIKATYKTLEKQFPNKLPNIICFTNIPFHYGRGNDPPSNLTTGLIELSPPRTMLAHQEKIVSSLQAALNNYKFLPKEFNESKNFANTTIKYLVQ